MNIQSLTESAEYASVNSVWFIMTLFFFCRSVTYVVSVQVITLLVCLQRKFSFMSAFLEREYISIKLFGMTSYDIKWVNVYENHLLFLESSISLPICKEQHISNIYLLF